MKIIMTGLNANFYSIGLALSLLNASPIFAQATPTLIKNAGTSKDQTASNYKLVLEEKDNLKVVNFVDEKNNVKLRIEEKYVRTTVNGLDHYSVQELKIRTDHVLVNKLEEQVVSKKKYRKTGWERENINDLYVYDKTGKVIFEKKGVPRQELESVSENGSAVVATVQSPDLIEEVDDAVRDDPPTGEVFVYNTADGKAIYHKNEGFLIERRSKLSPSGSWLAYAVAGKCAVKMVDLRKGIEYCVPNGINAEDFNEVTDDGALVWNHKEYSNKYGGDGWNEKTDRVILFRAKK